MDAEGTRGEAAARVTGERGGQGRIAAAAGDLIKVAQGVIRVAVGRKWRRRRRRASFPGPGVWGFAARLPVNGRNAGAGCLVQLHEPSRSEGNNNEENMLNGRATRERPRSQPYTWLARDVIASWWWAFPLVLAEKHKFDGENCVLQKVCASQLVHLRAANVTSRTFLWREMGAAENHFSSAPRAAGGERDGKEMSFQATTSRSLLVIKLLKQFFLSLVGLVNFNLGQPRNGKGANAEPKWRNIILNNRVLMNLVHSYDRILFLFSILNKWEHSNIKF